MPSGQPDGIGDGGEADAAGPSAQLGDLLLQVLRLARRSVGRTIRTAYRLSLTELLVLSAVDGAQPLRLGDLSRHVGIPASTLTGLVGRLEDQGYIRRCADPADRRVVLVAGTPLLEALRPQVAALVRHDMEPVLAALEASEAENLLRGLERLAQILESREQGGGGSGDCTS